MNKKQQKKQGKAKQPREKLAKCSAIRVGPIADSYVKTLLAPWSFVAGVPAECNLPSQKTHGWIKGSFQTSATNGTGFVACVPTFASDANAVWVSDSTWAGTGGAIDTTPPTGVTGGGLNLPFSTANLTAKDVQARLVAAALTVKNTTNRLNAGGDIVGLQQPDHDTINGFTIAKMNAFEESKKFNGVEQKSITVNYFPSLGAEGGVNESDYVAQAAPFMASGSPFPIMGFIAQSTASAVQTYDYEFHVVVEYIGKLANAKSVTLSDPVGYASIQNCFHSKAAASRPSDQGFNVRYQAAVEAMLSTMSLMSCTCCT